MVAGHLSVVTCVVAVIWLLWLDHWCVIYDSFLSLTCVVCTTWLYVPAGCSYLPILCFTLYTILISPCGLMDTYDWMIRLVFHVWAQFEYISLSYIYWYYFNSIFPSLDILISTLEASELALFYLPLSCIPSRSNSTSALCEPLFIICWYCLQLLTGCSVAVSLDTCWRVPSLINIGWRPLEKPPRQRASDNRIVPRLSQADVRLRHNILARLCTKFAIVFILGPR